MILTTTFQGKRLKTCPKCGEWIPVTLWAHTCGWDLYADIDEDIEQEPEYYDDPTDEEDENVQEP